MKKVVLNISDSVYEKFCLEAIHEQKCITQLLQERIFTKPFHEEVESAFTSWVNSEFEKLMKD